MNYIGQDELIDIMGIGYVGEIRRGPDGELYQWVEGIDGLGNLGGWWDRVKKRVKRAAKRVKQLALRPWCIPLQAIPGSVKGIAKQVCRVVGKLSPLAHVPVVGSYYKGAAKLCKIAKGCGIAGLEDGLGDGTFALYQGSGEVEDLYGLAEDEVLYGLGQEDLTEILGVGKLGQVRRGPEGELYEWVEGIDGLGRRKRFWHCQRCLAIKKRLTRRKLQKRLRAKQAATKSATPSQTKPAGMNGLGDLYQAPDGIVYQRADLGQNGDLYGLSEDEDLYGIGEEDDLYGLAEDDNFYGFSEDEELYGLSEDDELYGLMEDEDLYGLAEDEDLYGIGEEEDLYGLAEDEGLYGMNGYFKVKDGVNGLEAYVPDKTAGTRMFVKPAQAPEVWKPLW
jgi:hypothetical protein